MSSRSRRQSKEKGKGKSIDRSTEWSDWVWDEDNGCWIASRTGPDGEPEYDYRLPAESQAPRGNSVAQKASSVSLDTYPSSYSAEPPQPQYTSDDNAFPKEQSTYINFTHYPSHTAYEDTPVDNKPTGSLHTDTPTQTMSGLTINDGTMYEPDSDVFLSQPTNKHISTGSSSDVRTNQKEQGQMSQGNPNSRLYGQQQEYDATGEYTFRPRSDADSSTYKKDRRVRGTKGDSEQLDSSYKVRKKDYKKFFVVGKVFSTLWTEPFEGARNDQTQEFVTFTSPGQYDSVVMSRIRRFVVVKASNRACTCLPVTSYQGLGVNKDRLNLNEHGVIYSHKRPQPVAGMNKPPLKIKLLKRNAPFRDSSLINYGRVYTVETNVKVKEIGDLDSQSKRDLLANFNSAFFTDDGDEAHAPSIPPSYTNVDFGGVGTGASAGHSSGATYDQYASSSDYATGTSSANYPSTLHSGRHPYSYGTEPICVNEQGNTIGHNYIISIQNSQQPNNSSDYTRLSDAGPYKNDHSLNTSSHNASLYGKYDTDHGSTDPSYGISIPSIKDKLSTKAPIDDSFDDTGVRGNSVAKSFALPGEDNRNSLKRLKSGNHTDKHDSITPTTSLDSHKDPTKIPSMYQTKSGAETVSDTKQIQSDHTSPETIESQFAAAEDSQAGISSSIFEALSQTFPSHIKNDFLLEGNQMIQSSLSISNSPSTASLSTVGSSYQTNPTSVFSVTSSPNIGERIVKFFLDDQKLKRSLQEAMGNVSPNFFQKKLRQNLKLFSEDLRSENARPMMAQAARAIRRHSRNTAINIGSSLEDELQARTLKKTRQPKELGHDDDDGLDDDGPEDLNDNPNDEDAGDGFFKEFEEVLLASASLQILRDRLELLVHPNSIREALLGTWPISCARTMPFELTYKVIWNARNYLKTYFPSGQLLGDVMTLSGDILRAQAMSCRDYLKIFWPSTGILVLEALENMLQKGGKVEKIEGDIRICIVDNSHIDNGESPITVRVTAEYSKQVMIMEVVGWLCAVARYSPDIGLAISSTVVQACTIENPRVITFIPRKLEKIPSSTACWPQLFPHGVLAQGYRTSDRKQGRGLEIAFADMAMVAGCSRFVEYDNGLIVDGLESVIIPVKAITADNAVEWHIESKIVEGTNRRLRTSDIVTKFLQNNNCLDSWQRELETPNLLSKRCLLAWSPEAHIALGIDLYANIKLKHSSAEKCDTLGYFRTIGFSLSLPAPHCVPGVKMDFTPTAVVASVQPSVGSGVQKILEQASRGNSCEDWILMYDIGVDTGWYIPQASAVLYVAHMLLQQQGYHLEDKAGNRQLLKLAQLSSNGSISASKSLLACIGFNVCRDRFPTTVEQGNELSLIGNSPSLPVGRFSQTLPNNDILATQSKSSIVESFSTMIENIWNDFAAVGSRLSELRGEFRKLKRSSPTYLHGVDIIDFCETKSAQKKMPIRQVKVDQAWAHLTLHQPTVIMCRDLGQPIIDVSRKLCQSWNIIPPNQKHLVMTGRALHHFLCQQEQGLGKNLEWHCEETLVTTHYQDGSLYDVIHTQKLKCGWKPRIRSMVKRRISKKTLSPSDSHEKSVQDKVSELADSGFVFTEKSGIPCHDLEPYTALLQSQLDVPSDSSDTSAELQGSVSDVSQESSHESPSEFNNQASCDIHVECTSLVSDMGSLEDGFVGNESTHELTTSTQMHWPSPQDSQMHHPYGSPSPLAASGLFPKTQRYSSNSACSPSGKIDNVFMLYTFHLLNCRQPPLENFPHFKFISAGNKRPGIFSYMFELSGDATVERQIVQSKDYIMAAELRKVMYGRMTVDVDVDVD